MKNIIPAIFLCLVAVHPVDAQDKAFPGLKKAMDAETYARSGLQNLSPEQRASLDAFIQDYVSGKQKEAADVAATEAVDRAVKDRKVTPPEVIESRIVGAYTGYNLRTVLQLANGTSWKPTNSEILSVSPIQSPAVVI